MASRKNFLFILGILTVLVLGFANVYYFLQLHQRSVGDQLTQQDSAEEESYSEEVAEAFDQSIDLRLEQYDNDAALALLESKYAQAEDRVDKAWYYLSMASLIVAKDPERGLTIFAELYNDASLPDMLRGDALYSAMLYASKIKKPEFTVEEAKKWIFAPEKFGPVVGINDANYDNIQTEEDVMALAIEGMDASAKLVTMTKRLIRITTESAVLKVDLKLKQLYDQAKAASSTGDTIAMMKQEVQNDPELRTWFRNIRQQMRDTQSTLFKRTDDTKTQPELFSEYLFALNFIQRVYTGLLSVGVDVPGDIDSVRGQLLEYAEKFKDDNAYATERAALITATSDMRYACSQIIEANFDMAKIDSAEIKDLLQNEYGLSDEAITAHGALLAAIAERPDDACYEPYTFIGNRIDPGFKEFLINRVGGWSEVNFTQN